MCTGSTIQSVEKTQRHTVNCKKCMACHPLSSNLRYLESEQFFILFCFAAEYFIGYIEIQAVWESVRMILLNRLGNHNKGQGGNV